MILRLLSISILFLLCVQAHAQTFPIQGNVMLSPPYSPYLTDLTAPGAQRLMLTVRVNDPTLSDYTCKLRLIIEGVGITLRTKASFFPQALTLQGGGIPQTFYGEDLIEYFNPSNLDFAGITRSAFDKTKRLPEGVYRFTFEVLDYNRGTVVSSKISTTAWIILNDPPLLNLPRLNAKISILDPINIPFTWTPRHSASPNAAFTTEYVFRMVELPPGDYRNASAAQTAANQAILSQVPLLESVLTQSQLVYGLNEPSLIPGRFYAWQVEARDTEGRDLFKNSGKSEVFVFQFGDALGTPLNLHSQGSTASAISLRWEVPSSGDMPEQYRISYQYNDKWYEAVTSNRWFTIGNLQADTRYPIKVRSEKGKQYSEYSASITLNTLDASSAFQCGQKGNDLPQQVPGTPLFRLLPGDKLSLGKFTILVTEASGTSGYFNGVGYMSIPAFNGAGIKVKFHGKVDQFYVLDGEAESIMTEGGWASNAIEVMEKIGEDRRKLEEKYQKEADIPVQLIIIGEIVAVIITPAGDIEIEKADGTKETIKHPLDEKTKEKETVVLTDEKGNSYTVSKEGVVSNSGNTTSKTVASNVYYSVNFTKEETQQYGFDKKEHEVLDSHYKKESIQGLDYSIAWKSIATGGIDKVKALASTPRPEFAKEAGFKSDRGLLPKLPGSSNELQLTLQGGGHEEVETITAYLQKKDAEGKDIEETIGKLNLISYNKVNKTLVLVPVNETTLPIDATSLQQELNKIYSQAVVQWQVRMEPSLKCDYDTDSNGLEYGSSGLLSNYTTEMRTIINDYNREHSIANDTYYLFLVPTASDNAVTGYMPRKKQAGFIFTNQLRGANLTKTIAHELAHGAFRLEHTFPELPENGTNLMDYSSTGTQLHKHQWDNIHDPVTVLGLFEGDEEVAMVAAKKSKPIVVISDNIMTEGKVHVHGSTSTQMKVKFETSDTTKTKIAYQLSILIESTKTTVHYPKTGYDTLIYNQVKEITLDSIPQGKYTLLCKTAKTEYVLNFFIRKQKLEVTKEQLKAIFPTTDEKRIEEVVKVINENSSAFDISTPERMAHFIGQIGAETSGLKKLKEDPLYPPRTVVMIFPYPKYGHLFENVSLDSTVYAYSYSPINYDEDNCGEEEMSRGNAVFPYSKSSAILNAYAATKSDTLETKLSGKNTKILVYKARTDVTKDNIKLKVEDDDYNSGLLRVKSKYIRSSTLFDVTYGCRMGNGNVASKDGSTYLGKGFIHITGKGGYREVSVEWNKLYPSDKKEFHGKDINLLETNVEVAIKASMVYWKIKKLNHEADRGTDENAIDNIGKIVNGSGKNLPNGWPERRAYTNKAVESLNNY